jgi:transcriptional regulator with XRE-family HTH domain
MAPPRPDSAASIGARLRLVRLAYGVLQGRPKEISQAEFARLCEIAAPAWNNFETGDNRISIDNALAVARRTGVGLDFIYRGERAGLPHAFAVEIERLENPKSAKRA